MKMQVLSLLLVASVVSSVNAAEAVSSAAQVVVTPSRFAALQATVRANLTKEAATANLKSAWDFVAVTNKKKSIAAAAVLAAVFAYRFCPVVNKAVTRARASLPSCPCPFAGKKDDKKDNSTNTELHDQVDQPYKD